MNHFGELDIKVVQWHIYLKAVICKNIEETRPLSEPKKLSNMKYLCKRKNLQDIGKCLNKF